jgi:predicted transglutaminase-like cysteine proteinase
MHALRTRPHQAPRQALHLGAWVQRTLLLACFLSASLAAPNLDKTQALALERYGQHAADTVIAWRRMLEASRPLGEPEKLEAVNTFFNRRILFEDDIVVWQQADYWASPLEFMGRGAGDCEDFAIAKYMSLLLLGMPNERLRMIYVRARFGGPNSRQSQAHMVLGYYAQPLSEPLILDNLIGSIRPAAQRTDLTPVFSFNNEGLWVPGANASAADPTARLSRWRGVLERMKQEGL